MAFMGRRTVNILLTNWLFIGCMFSAATIENLRTNIKCQSAGNW